VKIKAAKCVIGDAEIFR